MKGLLTPALISASLVNDRSTMKKTRSLDYTVGVLRELHRELDKEVRSLEARFGQGNFSPRLMLEMLKV